MPFQFYKASPSGKGNACGFQINSKDEAVYVSFVKQTSWDAEKRTGSFKGGDKCNVKFSIGEVGGLINVIEQTTHPILQSDKAALAAKVVPFSAYHDGGTQTTSIKFGPYIVDENVLKGITLTVTQTINGEKKNFAVGFTLAEAITVREFLKFALHRIYTAIHSLDKKRHDDAEKAKVSQL